MKQYIIDSGQLGGLYNVIFSALGILGLITFINTSITAYQSFWKYYLPLPILILAVVIVVPFTFWFLHAFLQPSLSQYSYRHGYELHENPMRKDIDEIKVTLNKIESLLKK